MTARSASYLPPFKLTTVRLAMAGATDYDIAACLRHSTTALVRRYAHLSPIHLQGVMERVSAFGKTPTF